MSCILSESLTLTSSFRNCIVLQQYFDQVGGRKKLLETSSLKKRESKHLGKGAVLTNRAKEQKPKVYINKRPHAAESKQWDPPAGSWEDDVASIDYCVPVDSGGFLVYISWENEVQTKHHTSVIYKKCPQKVRTTLIITTSFTNDNRCCSSSRSMSTLMPEKRIRESGAVVSEPLQGKALWCSAMRV